jgi:hypothetical protein
VANVNIYAEHKDLLDLLVTSGKAKSAAAATKTGPFLELREAYVFAASLALALNQPTPEEKMPSQKKDVTQIQDRIFFNLPGAREIAFAAAMTSEGPDVARESLKGQLELLSPDGEKVTERLALLDRYAYAGFEWLRERHKDESGVRDLVLSAVDSVECVLREAGDAASVKDPLMGLLNLGDAVLE